MQNNGVPIDTERDLLIKLAIDVRYIRSAIDEIKEKLNEHEERINKLEEWRAYILGASAVIAVLVSVIITLWRIGGI